MRVRSRFPYVFGRHGFTLPQGESSVDWDALAPEARRFIDELIQAGVVEVLDGPQEATLTVERPAEESAVEATPPAALELASNEPEPEPSPVEEHPAQAEEESSEVAEEIVERADTAPLVFGEPEPPTTNKKRRNRR